MTEEQRRGPRNTVDPHAGCNPTITERRSEARMGNETSRRVDIRDLKDAMNENSDSVIGRLAHELQGSLRWIGVTIEQMPTVRSLVDAASTMPPLTDAEAHELDEFFRGKQWPQDVQLQRSRNNRPILVVNWMPLLLAGAIDAERRQGLPPPRSSDLAIAKRVIVRTHADGQRLHNYLLSSLAEAVKERL